MMLKKISTKIPGLFIVEPQIFGDSRGFFLESWHAGKYEEIGIPYHFVQDNISFSQKNTLRGLHFQHTNPQGKLVYVLVGEIFDVAVDLRAGSPTFGQWEAIILSGKNKAQFIIPAGFAHGFCALSDEVLFAYKCTDFYSPQNEVSVKWDDPDLAIPWPIVNPILSTKDKNGLCLSEIPQKWLSRFL